MDVTVCTLSVQWSELSRVRLVSIRRYGPFKRSAYGFRGFACLLCVREREFRHQQEDRRRSLFSQGQIDFNSHTNTTPGKSRSSTQLKTRRVRVDGDPVCISSRCLKDRSHTVNGVHETLLRFASWVSFTTHAINKRRRRQQAMYDRRLVVSRLVTISLK